MTDITSLSDELAEAVRALVLKEIRREFAQLNIETNSPGNHQPKIYFARITTEVSAASGTTAGSGEGNIYRRNTGDDGMEVIFGNAPIYSMQPRAIREDDYRFVVQDTFGDFWVMNDVRVGIFQTQAGGIDEMAASTPGVANCTPCEINSSGDIVTVSGAATEPIYNLSAVAAAGSTYIIAVEDFNKDLLLIWEDCE